MKEVVARGGERTRVIHRFSSSIPRTFRFQVEPLDGSRAVSGMVEVSGWRWLFSKPTEVFPLQPSMIVSKGFWDTLYSVHVTPDQDVRIIFG